MNTETLRNLIEQSMENDAVPESVLDWVRQNAGKQLWRLRDQLPNPTPDDPFTVRYAHGNVYLTTLLYCQWIGGPFKGGYNFQLARGIHGTRIPTAEEFEELNAAYYRGRRHRNMVKRAVIARKDEDLFELVGGIARFVDVIERVKTAQSDLELVFLGSLGDWSTSNPIEDAIYSWMRTAHGEALNSMKRLAQKIL